MLGKWGDFISSRESEYQIALSWSVKANTGKEEILVHAFEAGNPMDHQPTQQEIIEEYYRILLQEVKRVQTLIRSEESRGDIRGN